MKDRVRVVSTEEVDKDFTRITKRVTSTVVENIYKGVKIPDDIFDILYELKSMDMLDHIFMYNKELVELLKNEAGVTRVFGEIMKCVTGDINNEKLKEFEAKMTKYLRS